ncbi:DUF4290 domain-containing protein [Prevotella dentasini]
MNIDGLDYNTQRERLILPGYGREIQKMIDHAITLPTKEERQQCAETIVAVMDNMNPQNRDNADYMQKLWDHLAIMAGFRLDIDYPCDVSQAAQIARRPEPMDYPAGDTPVRHYGRIMSSLFGRLKEMQPGEERDELTRLVANQMKRSLMQWSHGSADNEKVASDLARYTDGKIQLDLSTFKFSKISERDLVQPQQNNKKRR